MVLAMKAAGVVAAAGMLAGGSGITLAHLAAEVRTLQRQVYVLRRSADAYGLRFGNNGRQLVCIEVQRPSFGRQVTVLPAYKCVPSG